MAKIQVLDDSTIDKIAAGEVIERPASVIKELVENAIDAGAKAITVEIKEGGIEFIRVTDDGAGIEKDQIRNAFLRHATSKIQTVTDLLDLHSLGFRGEALSSIAAVSRVELISKTQKDMTGIRFCIEGGRETAYEEVGAPNGTTFIARNLFFNTPVRRKFLKTAMTEGSYVTDLLEHLAMSKPDISFKYVINGQTKFFTNGDGDLKAIIYRIFGRDIANEMMPFQCVDHNIVIEGFLGKPTLNRANRNFENYFVNQRYIKSKVISKAIEEGYANYLMQHRYPSCVIYITVPTDEVDVNVHPNKMEVRFSNQNSIQQMITKHIESFLGMQEMIPQVTPGKEEKQEVKVNKQSAPEPFEKKRTLQQLREESSYHCKEPETKTDKIGQFVVNNKIAYHRDEVGKEPLIVDLGEDKKSNINQDDFFVDNRETKETNPVTELSANRSDVDNTPMMSNLQKIIGAKPQAKPQPNSIIKAKEQVLIEKPQQLNFFDEKILTKEAKEEYRIVGQVFDTYWIVEYKDKMLMIDQHAAHEKIKYEQILHKVENNEVMTQTLTPPIVISVTPREADMIVQYEQYFCELGFVIEDFGMNAFALRGIPYDLFGYESKELFEEILTQLSENPVKGVPKLIREKIATMACKAAVKGNHSLSYEEADQLIEQLLSLDNPYNCPHGRPTIISMSKYEVEKKFKRIVT